MNYLQLVKADFVLAVSLTVVAPLILLLASFRYRSLLYRLLAYWRVSSLLAITVYLLMAEMSVGLATGVFARALIPPVLFLGDSLMKSSQPLEKPATSIYRWFYWWRISISLYCAVGVLFTLPLLACGLSGYVTERCAAWFVPPQMYASVLHPHATWFQLGQYALIALFVYGLYLLLSIYGLIRLRWRSK
ncbi:MAG: DUF3177 family protein [Cyclobacteriaceae bacterium]